jgi:hypothetical protein
MAITLEELTNALADVEKEDLEIAVLLVHPSDLATLTEQLAYRELPTPVQRPEWGGWYLGDIWGMAVVRTDSVNQGEPDVIPKAGGVRRLVLALEMARNEARQGRIPKELEPNRLQKLIIKARHNLIKLLGGNVVPPHA